MGESATACLHGFGSASGPVKPSGIGQLLKAHARHQHPEIGRRGARGIFPCTIKGIVVPKYHKSEARMFAEDLHQRIHLENNILFPRAIGLENAFAT